MTDLVKKEDVIELLRENINASKETDLLQVNNMRLVRNMNNYDLAEHDKQIRDEVIEETFKVLNQALRDLGQDIIPRFILDGVAEQLKGEQDE